MRLAAAIGAALLWIAPAEGRAQTVESDLDRFMARVLERRDENWRTLQQYVLDEREAADLRGPGGARMYGLEREYIWYIRDGVFVRSPVRFDGVELSEEERRRYEAEWLERELERDRGSAGEPAAAEPARSDGQALATLVREPRFVSAAYFLKFKFEPGRYAFVGAETYEGRRVLRIEYYPSRLFSGNDDEEEPTGDEPEQDRELEHRLEHQMNKTALVTLWVEPGQHQIVKYTFENLGMEFLPGRWFARLDDLRATMRMEQPFPGVWLPQGIDASGAVTLATGTYEVRYEVVYRNYREAEVQMRVR